MLMETISRWIGGVNDVLWTYVLVAALLGCAVWFTLRTRGVQFRLLGEMMRVLGESAGSGPEGERHVSSFQAFAVSLASRVGTGNLAGVATAIVVGGPGAVFWMWVIALVGAASAFVESTLAQLYKRRGRDSFIGGPAYYMERGLGRRWMGVLFAVLISVTFGFAFNSVQSNTICAAWEGAFGADRVWVGVVLTALTLLIIFGGIRRIARVSGVIVPIMALGYIVLALGVVLFNLGRLPEVLELIVADAFGWEQTLGGAVGAALMQGIKRGLFSNEAGMGSAPNVAATAHVSHPVKQGLIQTLGVFTDTLVICTCTAFIILFGGVPDASLNGIQLMETISRWIGGVNDVLWTYVLVAALLGCAVWFTLRTRGVQFRLLGEMMRVLGESAGSGPEGERHVSSFQAFAVSLASRVGTGNLAGVATAIVVGGPGAVFWMWVIALVGAASAFVESTLAQLYKRRGRDSFIGGPAYYMERGLGRRWMGVLFAVLISVTFGFAFNSVQSNTICAAWEGAFGADRVWVGVVLTALTLLIIFGGIRRIARVSGVIVPIMALGYIVLALGVVLFNLGRLPEVLELIVADAFGWEQTLGGAVGAALMQGIKRGLFSNEAGMGSAPNVAATAHVSHPVKQGLIQTLGVFTDTLVICTCTAFIILFGGVPDASLNGIQLTQAALESEIGPAGGGVVAVAIFLFAFSSIIGNYYYGEANIRFITPRPWALTLYRMLVGAMVLFGSVATLDLAWSLADVTMALMTLCNLAAIVLLGRQAFLLLADYTAQKRQGIKNPVFTKDRIPELKDKAECW